MKRPARGNEPRIVHTTEQSGDTQEIAISAENFDPELIARMSNMTSIPMAGYLLEPGDDGFVVVRASDGARLSHTSLAIEGDSIRLRTTLLLSVSDPAEAFMLSDLEQCAALMLTKWAAAIGLAPR